MYELNDLTKPENGMLYPTTEELTGGKLNRYQLALGAARGARMITNEYVKQRVIAEKLQALQKEVGGKEAEKPIATMVDAEYRDKKAVRLSITKISDGEYKLVERAEGEIVDIDEVFQKELAEEVAKIAKQKEALFHGDDDDFDDDWDDEDVESLDGEDDEDSGDDDEDVELLD